ncbi:hypothetical protein CC86DRAFT_377760 [Ophiobolus disseminans]|uniref:Uncharacterized protein n=1 Tax=Ophiobolus disseminans TaxID=1469910 RepID=A0A6A7AH64_9PLEO|nr:hypothetical protein CC86DRAFT_377760 [Ophiobolus disseminans]
MSTTRPPNPARSTTTPPLPHPSKQRFKSHLQSALSPLAWLCLPCVACVLVHSHYFAKRGMWGVVNENRVGSKERAERNRRRQAAQEKAKRERKRQEGKMPFKRRVGVVGQQVVRILCFPCMCCLMWYCIYGEEEGWVGGKKERGRETGRWKWY